MADFNICNSMLVTKHGKTVQEAQKILDDLRNAQSPEQILDRAERVRAIADFVAQQRSHADALNASAFERIENFIWGAGEQKNDPMVAFRRFMAYMTGSTAEDMTMNSVSAGQLSRISNAHGRIIANTLRETGMTRTMMHKLIQNESFGKDVVNELFPFDGNQKGANNEAFILAKYIAKEKERIVKEANAAGASIPYDQKHITTQYHNKTSMLIYGKEQWVSKVEKLIDKDQVFNGGPVDKDILRDIFDHITVDRENRVWGDQFSLAEVMSQHRALVFDSSSSWLEYNSLFGHQEPLQAILHGLEVQSDRTVLFQWVILFNS